MRLRRSMLAGILCGLSTPLAATENVVGLTCNADGYGVLITNDSLFPLDAGTVIIWNVDFVRHSGELTLEDVLELGDSIFVSGAVGSDYLSSPQPCTAEFVE